MTKKVFLLVFLWVFFSNCKHMNNDEKHELAVFDETIRPPIHAQSPETMIKHGDRRDDPYFWMKKRDTEPVLNALKAENIYYEAMTKPFEAQRLALFNEIKSRVKEDDASVPYLDGNYWYYSRYEIGKNYPIYSRKQKDLSNKEEILLDVNEIAKTQKYTSVGGLEVSSSETILAYSADFVGRRFYDIYFVNLKNGQPLKNLIKNTTGDFVWAEDNRHLFYTQQNPETLRSEKLFRYDLSTGKSTQIFFEKDEIFNLGISKSKTKKYIFMVSGSFNSSEIHYIPADKPLENFKIFQNREVMHEYDVEDGGDAFYIVTNWNAENFKIMKTPHSATKKENWQDYLPHRKDTYVGGMQIFKNNFIVSERFNGLTQLRVIDRQLPQENALEKSDLVKFPDQTYLVSLGSTPEFNSDYFRYSYQSMVRPNSVFDYYFSTKKSETKKIQEVPTYVSENYFSERIWALAHDGTQIPVSLVYRKDKFKKDSTNPIMLYGYGSYGLSMDASFRGSVVSLLDRGFVYAIIHVRGGSEMGRYWYEQGRMMNKKNTFSDFVEVTEFLVNSGYASKNLLFASGGSAGGLLMGGIMNLRPELYRGLLFDVPFVDVLTTMLDPDIPLTTAEYEQWGNPNEKPAYDYIKSYSPYDQLKPQNYPYVFVSTGYHDSQVQYWEPAKFVARLRDVSKSKNPVLFRVDMNSGHSGASGRFEALKDLAHEFSFVLQLSGVKN
jgi:oligopeptidase B